MADQPEELDGATLLTIGLTILAIAVPANITVFTGAITWVSQYGWPAIIGYSAAALAVMSIPVIMAKIGPTIHLRIAQTLAFAFCAWVTMEDSLHASEGFKAPAGAMHVAEVFVGPDKAAGLVTVAFVVFMWLLLEVFSHLTHHGVRFACNGYRKHTSPVVRKRRK
jgi:hypothetical protein